eukprot:5249583-Pleurochrysis_carterae.AAC.1
MANKSLSTDLGGGQMCKSSRKEEQMEDEIFNLKAAISALEDKVLSLAGCSGGVELHNELMLARKLLEERDADLAASDKELVGLEAELRAARHEIVQHQQAAAASTATAAAERSRREAAEERAGRMEGEATRQRRLAVGAESALVPERLACNVLVSALAKCDEELCMLAIEHA